MYTVPDSPLSIESRSFMLFQWIKLDLFRSEIDRYTQEYLITAQQTAFGCWNVHQRVKDEAGFDHLEIAQPIRKPLKHKQKVSVESSFKGFYLIPSSFDAILLEKLLHRRDGFLRISHQFCILNQHPFGQRSTPYHWFQSSSRTMGPSSKCPVRPKRP